MTLFQNVPDVLDLDLLFVSGFVPKKSGKKTLGSLKGDSFHPRFPPPWQEEDFSGISRQHLATNPATCERLKGEKKIVSYCATSMLKQF